MKWKHLVWMGVFIPVFWSCSGDKETDFSREARNIKKTYKPAFAERKIKHLLLYTHSLCQHYGVDYHVVKGVIAAESGWNHLAESPAHCKGLMQISRGVCVQLNSRKADLFDPFVNITLGVLYLHWLQGRYKEDIKKVLKAYNEGPSRAEEWRLFNNHDYANKVLQLAERNWKGVHQMNGYLNGLKTAWNNKAVQNTLAGVGGFIAGRAYPAVREKAEKGLKNLQQKWEKEDAPAEQPEPSEEG